MTISTTTTKVAYTGNGIITQWAVNFPITAREDIKAIVTTPAGVDTALSYGTDYTVTPVAPPGIGATVNISPAVSNGSKLTLYLSTPITQPTDYENSGFLDLEQAEKSYDRLTLICQQLAEALGRAIKTGITSAQSPDQLLAFITQTAGQVATDAAAVATAMGNLFRYPIAQFTTTPGVLDYTLTHPADPTSNNVFLVMGGLPQQPGVDFTLPNATTIRFASNPGTQTVWGFITLSQSNPDISAQVQASVAAGIAQIQAFLDTQLAPTGQLGIAAGGTGASTAAGARANLGAATGADISTAITAHNASASAHGLNGTGKVQQVIKAESTSQYTITSIIPYDNTVPQSTEGTEVISITVTPKLANSFFIIEACALAHGVGVASVFALFAGGANAIGATFASSANAPGVPNIIATYTNTDTTNKTFSLRAGPGAAGTVYVNAGGGGNQTFGASSKIILMVTEVAA